MDKFCSKCKVVKPLTDFHICPRLKSGYRSECKKCNRAMITEKLRRQKLNLPSKLSLKLNPERAKSKKDYDNSDALFRKYGITLEDYNNLLKYQGGCCSICGLTEEEHGKKLCVDHDHFTLKVRGLLCTRCNQGLGMFKDSEKFLYSAITYLQKSQRI